MKASDFLTVSKKLKIWALVTHGLILIGAGHGIAFFFMMAFIFIPFLGTDLFNASLDSSRFQFSLVGLSILAGQASLIYSILAKKEVRKTIFHMIGLFFLWLSIVYFTYLTTKDSYKYIAMITVVPFGICTIITFLGKLISKAYSRIVDI